MQTSAMKACFQIAECSLPYAKTMQTSTMKACFQIAECSLPYAKKQKKMQISNFLAIFFSFFIKYVIKRTIVPIFFHKFAAEKRSEVISRK